MTDNREKDIKIIIGLIQDAFVKKDVTVFGGAHALVAELENSLRRARYESNRYEFKAGICRLSNPPSPDQSMYEKLARTACAIANTNPGEDGYIYLGVADNKEASERISKRTGQEAISIGEVFFVGLDFDLEVMKVTMEEYMKKLISGIEKQPISELLKTQIVTTIDHAEYKGRPFVRIRVPHQDTMTAYSEEYYVRKNSDTVKLNPTELVAQANLFRIQNNSSRS